MGTLREKAKTKDKAKGLKINGVTLGEPAWSAYNEDGTPAPDAVEGYDDPRIPDGEVEPAKDRGGKDRPMPLGAVKNGDVYVLLSAVVEDVPPKTKGK